MAFEKFTWAKKQAQLSIHFLIIGGGIAGLASAIALNRVGHTVTVVEQDCAAVLEEKQRQWQPEGPCSMPPNLSKILYHWGLEDDIRRIAIKSESISIFLYETGELLGRHRWDAEVLRETRGEFVFTHHSSLRHLLYDLALHTGVKVISGAQVLAIDGDDRTVTLATGQRLEADVLVGADGPLGLARQEMQVTREQLTSAHMDVYCLSIPKAIIIQHEDLSYLYEQDHVRSGPVNMYNWFGEGITVLAFPTGVDGSEFGMFIYAPSNGRGGDWSTGSCNRDLQNVLTGAEYRLKKLAALATKSTCIAGRRYPELEDWVHDSGRMVVLGEAVHVLPPGSVQAAAMTVEDAAVLAKLFSHLSTEDQIGSFLWAFQDVRQPRTDHVLANEMGLLMYQTLPSGQEKDERDNIMRSKRDMGIGILESTDDSEEDPQWAEVKDKFGYDAEDEADNWWVQWGMLRQRAKGEGVSYGMPIHVEREVK